MSSATPRHDLLATLDALRARARGLSLAYGVGLLVMAACGLILLGGLTDYLLRLPGLPRLLGLLAAGGMLTWASWKWIGLPWRHRPTRGDVAGRVEEAFPQFQDRLRSSVQFLGEPDVLRHDPFRRRVVDQASDVARQIDLHDVLVARPALLSAAGGVGAVLLLVLLAVLLGPLAGIVAGRLFDPLNTRHQWPRAYAIAPLEVIDRVPAGRSVPVVINLTRGDATRVEPVVYYRLDDGPTRQMLMTRQPDGTFAASVDTRLAADAASGSLAIWVEAGDDRTPVRRVQVVPRLHVEQVVLHATPPPYVQSPRATQTDLAVRPAVVGEGSQVRIDVRFNKPLAADTPPAFDVTGTPAPRAVQWDTASHTASATFVAQESFRFQLAAVDADGFAGDLAQTYEVVVRPDQPPTIQIDSPRRNEARTPVAVVPLEATADDDFGFRTIDLHVVKLGEDGWSHEVPLYDAGSAGDTDVRRLADAGDRVRLGLRYEWELATLAGDGRTLEPGDVLEFWLRAQDNFDLDGRYHDPVDSGRLRLTIISQEELNQRVIRELRDVRDQVDLIRQGQDRTLAETRDLAEQLDGAEADEATRATAGRLSRQQAGSAAASKRLAEKVEDTRRQLEENRSPAEDLAELTERIARQLDRAAEGPMRTAVTALERAGGQTAGDDERRADLDRATDRQQDASRRLRQIADDMEQIGSLRTTIDNVQRLLEQQRQASAEADRLAEATRGQTPEQMTAQDRQAVQEAADRQQQLAEQTEQALRRMEELAQEMQETDPASADAMRRAARAGGDQQVSRQQQQAAQAQRQNQQQQARRARQQAEIGLEVVLKELRDAERRQLEELARQLAELQEQVARLVRRQAGHNVDNLTLRGEAAADDLRQLARADQEEIRPTPARLSAGQELTERNTRDLSRTGENVRQADEVITLLTRAAGRMERAAVFLRSQDLPRAFEPPQQEALTALLDANEAVERQLEAVEQELADRQREAIRQRLAEVRDAQLADVNTPTSDLQVKRDDGTFRVRPDQIRLNQLPPTQDDLATRVDDISQDLADVGGVAFVYANRRVHAAMQGVAGDLRGGDTSAAVQRKQTQIVAALDAMIESLRVTTREERFERDAQAGGGKGGGDGGPSLPSEAELRLIRQLQQDLRDETADAADDEDRAADGTLADLAVRQGELREVLDGMLRQHSRGQIGLGDEPADDVRLPEEVDPDALDADLDADELADELLGEGAGGSGGAMAAVGRVGDRMSRSRQRLAGDDPGVVTRRIQERVLTDLDELILESQSRQQQASSGQQQQDGSRRPQPSPQQGEQAAQNQGQNQPGEAQQGQEAASESSQGPAAADAELSAELRERFAEWGSLSPRQRQAVLDTEGAEILDEYRRLIEEYYRTLGDRRQSDRQSQRR